MLEFLHSGDYYKVICMYFLQFVCVKHNSDTDPDHGCVRGRRSKRSLLERTHPESPDGRTRHR